MSAIEGHRDKTRSRVFVVIENFLAKEAHGGVVLFGAAVIAMVWANSGWADSYHDWWHTTGGLSIGDRSIEMDPRHWVNDVLMPIFFLMTRLEIKRELTID